jgi:hypothetical protein
MKLRRANVAIPWFPMAMVACCGLCIPDESLATQRGAWEIGLDVAGEFATREFFEPDPFFGIDTLEVREKLTEVPQGAFRAGYFFTDAFSLEASLGLSYTMHNPSTNVDDWRLRVGLVATYAIVPSSWISPFLSSGVSARSYSHNAGYTRPGMVLGIPIEGGVRIRLSDDHSIRIQSGVIATFEPTPTSFGFFGGQGDDLYWTVPIRVGWSLNTRSVQGGSPQ